MKKFVLCLAGALAAAVAGAATYAQMEVDVSSLSKERDGRYPKIVVDYGGIPGKGHVQGICVSPRAIYLARTHDIVKADWRGNILARVAATNHTGDICWWNGRIYSSIAGRKAWAGKGRIQVFDEDLNLLRDVPTAKTMDGITCLGGVLHIGNGVKAPPGMKEPREPHGTNLVIRYDAVTLEPLGDKEEISHGQNTCWGIQNLTTDGERLFARFYAPTGCADTVIYTRDWKPIATMKVPLSSHGLEYLGGNLFLFCHTLNSGDKYFCEATKGSDKTLRAELTFWRLTESGFVNVTAATGTTGVSSVAATGKTDVPSVAAAHVGTLFFSQGVSPSADLCYNPHPNGEQRK